MNGQANYSETISVNLRAGDLELTSLTESPDGDILELSMSSRFDNYPVFIQLTDALGKTVMTTSSLLIQTCSMVCTW